MKTLLIIAALFAALAPDPAQSTFFGQNWTNAPTFVAGCNAAGSGTVTSVSCGSLTISPGDEIVIMGRLGGSGATAITCADSNGSDVYTSFGFNPVTGSFGTGADQFWYIVGALGGTGVSFTCSYNAPSSFAEITVCQYHPGFATHVDATDSGKNTWQDSTYQTTRFNTPGPGLIVVMSDPAYTTGTINSYSIGSLTTNYREGPPFCFDAISPMAQSAIQGFTQATNYGDWGGAWLVTY